MKNTESYGKLYEIFIKIVFEHTNQINTVAIRPNVKKSQMMDLVEAEEIGNSTVYCGKLLHIVQDQILMALVRLHQVQLYEWQKSLITNLILKTLNAISSTDLIQVINQAVTFMYLEIG